MENEMYVLYADIMGFKDRVIRTEHTDLEKDFENLLTGLDYWFKPNKKSRKFKVSFFSDSILIIEENTKDGFNRISKAAAGLMQVSLKHKFPIKGVIAKGKFTYKEKKQLFFGRALVDAYELENEVHYYGIVAHHTVEKDIQNYSKGKTRRDKEGKIKTKGANPYVLSPIPLKRGNTTHYHLAYNLISKKRETGNDIEEINRDIKSYLEEISGTVSGTPRIYIDKTLQVLKEDLEIFKEHNDNGNIEFPLSKK